MLACPPPSPSPKKIKKIKKEAIAALIRQGLNLGSGEFAPLEI